MPIDDKWDDEAFFDEQEDVTPEGIAEQDRYLLDRQWRFRVAADAVAGALARFAEVEAVALFGSVAVPLEREVPRFQPYRRQRIRLWHECKDVDLAVWLDRTDRLQALNRARNQAVQRLFAERKIGVANHQVDVFLLRAGGDEYLGRLCGYAACPKGKIECLVPGCGRDPFLKQHPGFRLRRDALVEDRVMRLYERGRGIVRRAADTPACGQESHAETP